jgi:hypothetical protein
VEKAIPGVPAHTWVPHVEPSPLHAATAFVVFDDHRRGNFATYVYETNDFGATWRSLVTPNLRGYAHTIAQDLVDKDLLFLGTEFGLWFTLDGGKAWHPFTHGIPAGVAVMGLAVHPREHDLVVGTHGRAAFVIDDIRPLRELSAATLTQPLSVFTSGPATQHTTKQTGGSRFPGHGEFKGATRPYGALVAFSVADDKLPHPDPLVERARKNKAPAPPTQGAAADPARPDAAKDSKDKSDKEKTPKVTLEVRDLQGQLLRTFKRPVHQGLNRVAWDLRRKGYKSPRSPRDDEERPRDDDDEPAGAEVAPGEYVITVHYKDHSATTPITVQPDPRVDLPAADRAAKAEALDHAGRLRGALAAALERIQAVRADLDAVDKKLAPEPAADGSNPPDRHADLKAKMRAVREQLTALEKQIWTPSDTKGIPDAEHALAAVGEAASALGSSWHKPTAAQAQLLRTAEAKVIAAVASLNALVTGDVAAVRKLASDAGAGLLAEQPALEIK